MTLPVRVFFLCLLFAAVLPAQTPTNADFFNDTGMHEIHLTMTAADWTAVQNDLSPDHLVEKPATLVWNGLNGLTSSLTNVGIKQHGHGSLSTVKPSLKLGINDLVSQSFLGLNGIVLRANTEEASLLNESVAMKLYAQLGLNAPRESPARVYINTGSGDVYLGVYHMVEDVNKQMLTRIFGENNGPLYEGERANGIPFEFQILGTDPSLYAPYLNQKGSTLPDYPTFALLVNTLNNSPDSTLLTDIAPYMDLKKALTYLTVETYLADNDSFLSDPGTNNYFLYRFSKGVTTLHEFIPWDRSNTFYIGGASRDVNRNTGANCATGAPCGAVTNMITKRALNFPDLANTWYQGLLTANAVAGTTGGWLDQEITRQFNIIQADALKDTNKQCPDSSGVLQLCSNDQFLAAVQAMHTFVQQRPGVVLAELAKLGVAVPVLAASPGSVTFRAAAGAKAVSQTINLSSTVSPSLAFSASATSTTGGSWLSVSGSGNLPGVLTLTATPGTLAAGSYTGSVVVTAAASNAPLTIPVTLNVVAAGSLPAINANGIVDAANFSPTVVAPGSLVSIFGTNLASSTAFAGAVPLPISMADASVTAGSKNAPLLYVSPTQINLQLPWETATGSATITGSLLGLAGNGATVTVGAYSPGIFVTVYPDGSVPSATKPAGAGDILVIYANGLGAVSNQPATGSGAPLSPLAQTSTKAAVTIGGVPATVQFSGLAPNFVGLYQVNVQVPTGVAASSSTAVIVSIGGQSSPSKPIATK